MGKLITRRGLLVGLGGILAAPAIVRASSLMPVKSWTPASLGEATLEDALLALNPKWAAVNQWWSDRLEEESISFGELFVQPI